MKQFYVSLCKFPGPRRLVSWLVLLLMIVLWNVCRSNASNPVLNEAKTNIQQNAKPVPLPHKIKPREGRIQLDKSWSITAIPQNNEMRFAAEWLRKGLQKSCSIDIGIGQEGKQQIILIGSGTEREATACLATYKLAFPVLAKFQQEGYLLEAITNPQPMIVIAAHTAAGAFYGVNTLLQLISSAGVLEGISIMDYPDHTLRGIGPIEVTMKPGTNGILEFTQAEKDAIDTLASQKYNMIFCHEYVRGNSFSHFHKPEPFWKAYQEEFRYARERHIELIPNIGTLRNINEVPLELVEGWWVQDEAFTFDGQDVARPDNPSENLVVNGDFKKVNKDGIPDGWTVDNPRAFTLIPDKTNPEKHLAELRNASGNSDGERPALKYVLDIPIPGTYRMTARVRLDAKPRADITDPDYPLAYMSAIQRDGAGEKKVEFYCKILPADKDWRRTIQGGDIRFDKKCKVILSFFPWKNVSGSLWVTDVQFRRVLCNLMNVIRDKATDVVVTSADKKTTYVPGKDYEVVNGDFPSGNYPTNVWQIPLRPGQKPFVIKRLPEGVIAKGQKILAGYDSIFAWSDKDVTHQPLCVSDESLYTEYIFPAIDRVIENFHPKFIYAGCDEIMGLNRDSRCRKRNMTNAELFAEYVNKVNAHIKQKDPNCRMWICDDMVSPYHNGGELYECAAAAGGVRGSVAEAVTKGLLDKSILIAVWCYGNDHLPMMNAACSFFGQKGFQYAGLPWKDLDNIDMWAQLIVDRPGSIGCWKACCDPVPEDKLIPQRAADRFWNTRGKIIFFEGFENDGNNGKVPDGWILNGSIEYSKDGSCQYPVDPIFTIREKKYFISAVKLCGGNTMTSSLMEAKPDTAYELVVHVQQDVPKEPGAPQVIITWYDQNRRAIKTDVLEPKGVSQKYSAQQMSAASPPDTAFLSIMLNGGNNPAAGFWFDTLYLIEKWSQLGL